MFDEPLPKYWAVVPAAGIGKRMLSDCPKQYLALQGKPILQHTLERLSQTGVTGIVVCIAEEDAYWPHMSLDLPVPLLQAEGGQERCHSVLNGLALLAERAHTEDWVLVHDAARPCVRVADIQQLMQALARHPVGGLLAMPVRDTLKRANEQQAITATVDRQQLWHAFTPQMFRLGMLTEALQAVLDNGQLVTDEAQAMELQGHQPVLIESHTDNLKITHPTDLELAALYMQRQLAAL